METRPTHFPHFADVVALAGVAGIVWLFSLSVLMVSGLLRGPFQALEEQRRPARYAPSALWPIMPPLPAESAAPPILEPNRTAAEANNAWTLAITRGDTATAQALFRPADGSDPAERVATYIHLLERITPRHEPLRDVRYHGNYTPSEIPGVRIALSELVFKQSQICLQTTLVHAGPAGWYVQAWEQLDPAVCAAGLHPITANE